MTDWQYCCCILFYFFLNWEFCWTLTFFATSNKLLLYYTVLKIPCCDAWSVSILKLVWNLRDWVTESKVWLHLIYLSVTACLWFTVCATISVHWWQSLCVINMIDQKPFQNAELYLLNRFASITVFLCLIEYRTDIFILFSFIRTERGTYYALHLGGTNFRVLRVQLNGQPSSDFEHEVERQPIPQHVMTSTSEVTWSRL